MAPQPLGLSDPMVQGHLMTIEIRGVDLILSQALKMNMHEVPSYHGSRANNSVWEESNMPAYNKPRQNSLQSRLRVGQACF